MSKWRNIGGLVFSLALFSALISACQGGEGTDRIDLSPQEFSAQIRAKGDSVLLVDVRTPEEFGSGRIAGAVLADFQGADFAAEVAKLPKDKQLFIYCRSGRRSAASAPVFAQAGFKTVRNLDGGIVGWQSAGLPVVRE